jgi:hypothetical protein
MVFVFGAQFCDLSLQSLHAGADRIQIHCGILARSALRASSLPN